MTAHGSPLFKLFGHRAPSCLKKRNKSGAVIDNSNYIMPKTHHPYHTPAQAVAYAAGHAVRHVGTHAIKHVAKRLFGKSRGTQTKHHHEDKQSKTRETIQHNELVRVGDRIIMHKYADCKPMEGRWRYVDQITGVVNSAEGQQGVGDIGYYCLWSQFRSATALPSRTLTKTDIGNGFFLMNPYQKTTGGDATNNTAVVMADDRIVLEKIDCRYSFMNDSLVNVVVDIYCVTPKAANYYGPSNAWNTLLAAQTLGTNPASIQRTAAAIPGAGYAGVTLVGQRPFENASFCKQFKLLKHKSMTMSPGENVDWNLDIHYNWICDRAMGDDEQQGAGSAVVGVIPNKSVYIFMVVRGAVVKDLNDSSFTYGQANIGVVSTNEYFLRATRAIQDRQQINYVVPNLTTGSLYAKQALVSDVDGIINNNTA